MNMQVGFSRTTFEIDPARSVAGLAQSMPGAARTFEELGIDYCCRGAQSLLHELDALTLAYCPPAEAGASYAAFYAGLEDLQADLHAHIHLENNVLFPAALELQRQLGRR
jgi:iron-sulfur cluster repair protein YtfE (RIC family)